MKIIDIESSFLEELRCGMCNDYLICFPIRACADGQIICGNCKPEGDDMFAPYKVPLLEKMLKNVTFSCKFEENGCDQELSVDLINEHELKCVYRAYSCSSKDCDWKGLLVELPSHFSDKHSVCDKVEITTNWKDDLQDILLASMEGVPVLVDYKFCKDTKVLSYKISYISAYIQEASYQIYSNNETLTGGQCLSYNHSTVYEDFNIKALFDCVLSIKITFINYPQFVVDYGILKFFLCKICGNYLIPFAYDYQPSGYICGFCEVHNDASNKPSTKSIFKIIQNPNFPCKWKYCHFVSNANIMYHHEKACQFRIYNCFLDTGYGDLAYIKGHLEDEHEFCYFRKEISVTRLPEAESETIYRMFTIRNGRIIALTVSCKETEIVVNLHDTEEDEGFQVYLEFKHDHCSAASKQFCVVDEYTFTMDHLPDCFKKSKTYTALVTVD